MIKKVLCIIPTLNAEYEIEILINKLLLQKDVLLDILVIDSSSDDNTISICKSIYQHSIPKRMDYNSSISSIFQHYRICILLS